MIRAEFLEHTDGTARAPCILSLVPSSPPSESSILVLVLPFSLRGGLLARWGGLRGPRQLEDVGPIWGLWRLPSLSRLRGCGLLWNLRLLDLQPRGDLRRPGRLTPLRLYVFLERLLMLLGGFEPPRLFVRGLHPIVHPVLT